MDPLAAQVLDSFFKTFLLSRTYLFFYSDQNMTNIGSIFPRTTQVAGEEIPLQLIPYEVSQ